VEVNQRLNLAGDYQGSPIRADGRDHSILGKLEVRF
jgi:hypothetical protein